MNIIEIDPYELSWDLLLEADPSERSIQSYLSDAWGYVVLADDEQLAVCVVKPTAAETAEVFNLAVAPGVQAQGLGSKLMDYVLCDLESQKRIRTVVLGTGAFGYQLAFYHKLGFRVDGVLKDHFLEHYPEPVFENGIQHKDMLRLSLKLGG